MAELNIGRMLVASGIIDPMGLRRAQRFQDAHPHMPLASCIVYLGLAGRSEIDKVVAEFCLFKEKRPSTRAICDLVETLAHRSRELSQALELFSEMLKNTL